MCRIFFSLFSSTPKKNIYDFLKQSNHKYKNTPGINNHRDQLHNLDGFGIAYLQNKKWNVYKKPFIYLQDPKLDNKLTSITQPRNHIFIGHIRKKTYGETTISNTHPFMYENRVFMQNGHIKDFHNHKLRLLKYVHPEFQNKIKGETDTELLFFLFLTIYKEQCNLNCKKIRQCEKSQLLFSSLKKTFNVFKKLQIEITANIIYADDKYAFVTRYIHYSPENYREPQYPLSLYYNNDDGITISSEPILTKNNILFPENTMIIMNHTNMREDSNEDIIVYNLA